MPEQTLTAKLQFQGDAAIAGMMKAGGAFSKMHAHAKIARQGVQNLRQGFAGFNVALAGAGVGAVAAVKKFADFDGQMGAVKAVLGKEAAPEFEKLETLAAKLGATTSFTATQSAEAMENLARAGFGATQIMTAVPEVLAAAAAEGMDLGTAADIVASNIKAFQLEATDAARVADTLAFVSAKTNTNMVGLQEGMKFVAPVAKSMGVEIEDTAAALGALADVGLKGSLAGTGLKNALLKISKQAKDGQVKVGKFNAEIVKTESGGVDLSKTMFNIVSQLQKIDEPTERAQASMKLLGLRGMGSAAAFDALGKNQKLVNTLFVGMKDRAQGAAKGMQAMRLDTLKGDFTLLSSAVDGFMNSVGKALRDFIRPWIAEGKNLTDMIGSSAQMITKFWGADGEVGRAFLEQDLITQGANKNIVQFARGFVEGIKSAADIFKDFFSVLKGGVGFIHGLFSPLGSLGPKGSGVKGITKLAFQVGALGLSIKVATKLFGQFASVAKGSFQVVSGVLGTVKTGLGGTVQLLSTKLPTLARILPGGLRKLTGAVSAVEKVTAQPVRVVNFDEAGMGGLGGGAGVAPGQQPLFGPGGATDKATKPVSRLGRAAQTAGGAVAVFGAGLAGWQIGKAIDQATGLSDKISDVMVKYDTFVDFERKRLRESFQAGAVAKAGGKGGTASQFAQQLATISRNVGAIQQREAGGKMKKVSLTRELAIAQIQKRYKGEFTAKEIQGFLRAVEPILARIPTKEDLASRPPTVVKVDGREILRAAGGATEENRERGGGTGIFAVPARLGPKPRRAAKR